MLLIVFAGLLGMIGLISGYFVGKKAAKFDEFGTRLNRVEDDFVHLKEGMNIILNMLEKGERAPFLGSSASAPAVSKKIPLIMKLPPLQGNTLPPDIVENLKKQGLSSEDIEELKQSLERFFKENIDDDDSEESESDEPWRK